jgi:zinc transporter ZupT
MSTWPAVVLFAAIAGVASLVGVWLMWGHESWARRHTPELITFASGLLVAGSLLHLLTRAGDMIGSGGAMAWGLAAFILLYIAENHFLPHPHTRAEEGEDETHHDHTEHVGWAAILGLAIHSLLDGLAVGAGFSASFLTGAVILSLVVSHKLPVGIATMSVLYHGGLERREAARYATWVALITPLAVLVSYALLRDASPALLGIFLAASGGTFLYVGAADLLPEGQASGRRRNTLAFLLGVAVMILGLMVVPGGGH